LGGVVFISGNFVGFDGYGVLTVLNVGYIHTLRPYEEDVGL
jgi:hypothetical protein